MGKVVITGIGPVAPIGVGRNQFWNAAVEGRSGIKKTERLSTFPFGLRVGQVGDFDCDQYVADKRFRRVADISKYTLAAVGLALEDAGLDGSDTRDAALIFGITHGPLNYTQAFHRTLLHEGYASPLLFSDSVLNAPAGNASIAFGIHGPVHTLVGGAGTAVKALMLAAQMVADDRIERVMVVSAEELNELSLLCYSRLGMKDLSEGAGALVLERERPGRERSAYCTVSGTACELRPADPEAALGEAARTCLAMAEITWRDVDLVMLDSCLSGMPSYLDGSCKASTKVLAGNAFSVTSMWNMILSVLAMRHGMMPLSVMEDKACARNDIRHVMICCAEQTGAASVALLSKE